MPRYSPEDFIAGCPRRSYKVLNGLKCLISVFLSIRPLESLIFLEFLVRGLIIVKFVILLNSQYFGNFRCDKAFCK